jgi:hypothetical protein
MLLQFCFDLVLKACTVLVDHLLQFGLDFLEFGMHSAHEFAVLTIREVFQDGSFSINVWVYMVLFKAHLDGVHIVEAGLAYVIDSIDVRLRALLVMPMYMDLSAIFAERLCKLSQQCTSIHWPPRQNNMISFAGCFGHFSY